jgi:hypothetical protein
MWKGYYSSQGKNIFLTVLMPFFSILYVESLLFLTGEKYIFNTLSVK